MKGEEVRNRMIFIFALFYMLLFLPAGAYAAAIVIDHTCTDLSQIPSNWIDQVKTFSFHYAHTSHGEQITVGLGRIESSNAQYSVAIDYNTLPTESGALCIFDGQTSHDYIVPEDYWDSPEGRADTGSVLSSNPEITYSMWAWCCQQIDNSYDDTQRYLDSMAILEADNPGVTFIYMTGNAQEGGAKGYNRYQRNNQIREYCNTNGKVLFDFADIDCWYNGEQNTYQRSGTAVPIEHSRYNGDEAGHTTYESCEQKGKAFWWMMARLAGWDPGTSTTTVGPSTTTTVGTDTTTTTTTGDEGMCPSEAIYGEHSEETELLRCLRDNVLSATSEGRELITLYYEWSPFIVTLMRKDEEFRKEVTAIVEGVLQLAKRETE